MNNLAILMVLDSIEIGGTETHVMSLARQFIARGHRVGIAGTPGKFSDHFMEIGCEMHPIPFVVGNKNAQELVILLKEVVIRYQYQVIHAHQLSSAWVAVDCANQCRLPLIYTVHGKYFLLGQLKPLLARVDQVVCVSPALQRWLANTVTGGLYIPNGVDIPTVTSEDMKNKAAALRERLGIPVKSRIVLYAARLSWAKGKIGAVFLQSFYDLMQEFSDWHAVVAGNGDDFNKLETFARAVNKEKLSNCIHLLGEQKNMDELYAAVDCVVGTGRVALEAMSFGKPVIAAGSSGMIGVVTPSVHKLAVETHFSEHENGGLRVQRQALGTSLRQVMQDERSAAAWGKEGVQLIRKVYDNQRLIERWIQLYLKAIKSYREG